jgi:CheY-like chemotaxis protein
MSSSSSTTRTRGRSFIRPSYHPDREIPAPADDCAVVARILICEPHSDISALLELVVRRLGHEPVTYGVGDSLAGVDAAVIEPGETDGLRVARELRERDVPVLFTSIYSADDAVLELHPSAYLIKPFPLYALERALVEALAAPVIAAL